MKKLLFVTALAAVCAVEAEEGAEVVDLGNVVVEGASISKYSPETVRSATYTDVAPELVPVTVNSMTEDYIRDRSPRDLDEILATVPGVSQGGRTLLSRSAGMFTVRGMGGTTPTLNGTMPLSSAGGIYLDPNILERIDVVKGPTGALEGGSASDQNCYGGGGSIMLWQKRPDLEREFTRLDLRTSAGRDSYGTKFKGDVNRTFAEDRAGFRLPFSFGVEKPFWLGSDRDVGERFTVAPSFLFKPSDELKFGLDTMLQYGDTPGYQGINVVNGRPAGSWDWDSDISSILGRDGRDRYLAFSVMPWAEWTPTEDYTLRAGGGFGWTGLEYNHFGPNSSGYNEKTPYEVSYHDRISRNYNAYVHNIYKLETDPVKQTFLVGGDYVAKDSQGRSSFAASATGAPIDRATLEPSDSFTERYGLILQDQVEWGRFTAIAGIRGDLHRSANDNRTCTYSPRGGVSFKITDWLVPFYNYSMTQAPNFGYFRDPNDKGSELTSKWKCFQHEGGVKVRPFKKFWVTASAFRLEQENSIVTLADNSYDEQGKSRSRGFELSASGEITDNWSVWAAWTFIEYANKYSDVDIERFPKNSVSIFTSYKATWLFDTVWGFGYRYKHGWQQTFRGEQTADEYRIKGYSVFDASVEYPIDDTWSVSFAIRNLFDRRYIESARNLQCFPGDVRTFEIGLRANF